ncbi:MAG: sugar transferase [Planctomycetota bacterium]
MIIRSRRNSDSLLKRLLRFPFGKREHYHAFLVSAEAFLIELAKETSRSNRRSVDREFAVILIEFRDQTDLNSRAGQEILDRLACRFQQRLRLTDLVGWHENSIAVLLPETRPDGARNVANDLESIAREEGCIIETELLIYPWDDDISSRATELGLEEELPLNGPHCEAPDTGEQSEENEVVTTEEELASAFSALGCYETRLSELVPSGRSSISRMTAFTGAFPTPWWKRCVDIVCAGTGLVLLSPVLLASAGAIKLSSRGPVFFRQLREGKDGRNFYIWKFRTMNVDAETQQHKFRDVNEQDGPAFKLANDPRVTTVGRYMRKSCIDELPQLFNVLRGEMSIVGPRPLPVEESNNCSRWQRQRLRVLPGLTCIWQVNGGRNVKFDDWMRMDMRYLKRRGFLFDCKLIMKTAVVALMHRGSV